MDENKYLKISDFTDIVKSYLESNFSYIYLRGEVSNFRPSATGIWYLSLKDENSAIRGIVFKGSQGKILEALRKYNIRGIENGQELLVEGRLNVYKKSGEYSIIIEKVVPIGAGELYIKFEQLKQKLEKEGLFDSQYKKVLPRYPVRIGIVTSPTGAALQDMLNVLNRRFSSLEIIVFPASVQGQYAHYEIIKAILYADSHYRKKLERKVDVLILARGGGSIEDLWCFNEEELAYTIRNARVPIVTGVGHEIDFTIADFCADMRAPTPSAAAELVVKDREDLINSVASYKLRIESGFSNYLERIRYKLALSTPEVLTKQFQRLYYDKSREYSDLKERFLGDLDRILTKKRQDFILKTQKLSALNPLQILSRGYSVVFDEQEKVVSSVEQTAAGDKLSIRVADGTIRAVAESTEKGTEDSAKHK